MKINKLNYENYVIDYIEGTLSAELKKDFDLFLEKNKEVYDEIKDYMSAPILEEPEVIFDNKKAIRQSSNKKYALLVLLPLLLIGVYFILSDDSRKTESSETKIESIITPNSDKQVEVVNEVEAEILNIEQEDVNLIEQNKPLVEPIVKQKKVNNKSKQEGIKKFVPSNKVDLKKANEVQSAQIKPMNFASIEVPTPIQQVVEQRELIRNPSQIGAIEINFDLSSDAITSDKMILAKVEKVNNSEAPLKNKNWLEMITPASFDDIDLKESLAIQTNVDVNSTRKILNAFIPETFVK